jgi:hypothetical protein
MKKIFFTLAMASMVAFAACNKEDNKGGENNQPEEPKEQVSRVFEDFEGEGMLSWTGADGCSFKVVDNPSKTGINTTDKVGNVTAGGSMWEFTWSTGFGATEDSFNFVDFSKDGYIVKVDVYSPKANSPVYLKFEGVDVPAVEITTVTTTKANEWETLEFDYEPYQIVDGAYKNFVILFDAGVEGAGGEEFYFDNVRLCKE